MTQDQRRQLHETVNAIGHYRLAQIVKQHFPKIPASKINIVAKQVIREAHAQISPKSNK